MQQPHPTEEQIRRTEEASRGRCKVCEEHVSAVLAYFKTGKLDCSRQSPNEEDVRVKFNGETKQVPTRFMTRSLRETKFYGLDLRWCWSSPSISPLSQPTSNSLHFPLSLFPSPSILLRSPPSLFLLGHVTQQFSFLAKLSGELYSL